MTDSTDALKQQLHTLRETVSYLRERAAAVGGEVFLPPGDRHTLRQARAEIAECKAELRARGAIVNDEPVDLAPPIAQGVPPHQPSPVPQVAATNNDSAGNQGAQGVFHGPVTINNSPVDQVRASDVFQLRAPVPDFVGQDAEQTLRSSQSGRAAAISGLPWIILAVFLVLAGGYALYIVLLNAQDSQRAATVATEAALATPVPPTAAATTKPSVSGLGGGSAPTRIPGPTATPRPTSTSVPPTSSPVPLEFSGSGDQVLADVQLPAAPARATFSHSGGGNFLVWAYYAGDKRDLLANVIGQYAGSRPLTSSPVSLEITADGAWTLRIEPIELDQAAVGALSGEGDFVSAAFRPDPAGTRAYRFTHNGSENFIAQVRCGDDFDFGQNEIGPVDASAMVELTGSLCYWDVQADGAWTITPGS